MKKWIILLGMMVALVIITKVFFFSTYIVETDSMAPELHSGDRLLISKTAYSSNAPNRFDIIVFPYGEKHIIKRVIGLPGESIKMENNTLYVNGNKVEETFHSSLKEVEPTATEDFTLEEATGKKVVPEGAVFVLGDNREDSMDSRDQSIGFLRIKEIEGKIIMRFFPFHQLTSW